MNSDYDLQLPVIKGDPMPPPALNLDDYLEFVTAMLRDFSDSPTINGEVERSPQIPFVRFRIKE